MRKNLTYLVVIAVAALLSLPVQAQNSFTKKAALGKGQPMRTGMYDKTAVRKAKAAKAMEAKTTSFAEVKGEDAIAIAKAAKEADTTVGKSFAKWNWAAHATPKFVSKSGMGNMSIKRLNKDKKTLIRDLQRSTLSALTIAGTPRMAAPRKAETVDANGIITEPDEGETKHYLRSGSAWIYNSDTGGYDEGVIDGTYMTIVETADGTVYLKDIITGIAAGNWVKGTKEGNTITVPTEQVIYYNSSYSLPYTLIWSVWSDDEGDFVVDDSKSEITFTVDGDAISLEGSDADHVIDGCYTYYGTTYCFGAGEYNVTYTIDADYAPLGTDLVELPEGATVEEWYAETSNYSNGNSSTTTGTAKVAFVDSEVYIAGIFTHTPDAWIKGTLDGTTVTFKSKQYLGTIAAYGDLPVWAIGCNGSSLVNTFKFTYDAEAQSLTLNEGSEVLSNGKEDAIYYAQWIEGLFLSAEAPAPTQIDVLPYSNNFDDADMQKHFSVIDANEDGTTWGINSGAFAINYADNNDDWVVSPAIKLAAGKKYHFAIDSWVRSTNYPETFEVKAATEATAEALAAGTEVLAEQSISNTASQTFETEEFTVAESGYYYIGIHNTSADQWTQYVDNFLIEAMPISAPYTGDFMVEGTMDDFSTLDANGDENTWKWSESYGAYYIYSSTNNADDYLILPIKLEAPKNYNITVTASAASASYPEKFEVKVGKEATVEGLNITAISETTVNTNVDTEYEGSFTTDEAGTYYVAIHATSAADMWRLNIKKVVIEAGADGTAPAAPENFTVTPVEDVLAANIALTAPTKTIEGADLATGDIAKIEVLRDGNVIKTFEAPNPGDELSFTDEAEDLTIGTHKYQAISYATDGIGGKTEEVEVFLTATLTVPYIADFTVEGTFDAFQVINNNGDGKTWAWNSSNFAYYGYDSTNDADDYLVTSPILLEAGKNYNVIVNARASGYNERFEVLVGKTADADGLNITAIGPTELTGSAYADYEGTFTVDEDGKYFVAIHAISDADMYNLCVSKLTIEKGAEPTAPAAVSDFSATAGEQGALEVNISYSAPVAAIDGSELTGNVDVSIYRDDAVINTTSVPVGSVQTYKDTDVEDGKTYTYYIVAANESGNGQKSEKVSVFVGHDELGPVENFEVASSTATTITFNWDEVVGLNGGYVDASGVEYSIYTLAIETDPNWGFQYLVADEKLGSVTGETEATVDFNVDEGEQQYKYFGISTKTATAEETDPAEVYTYLIVGAPEELPIEEGFTGSSLHYNWNSNAASLSVSEEATDGDGVALALLSDEEDQTIYFQLDKVNLNGAANPCIIFDVKSDAISSVRVYGSADGGEKTVLQTINVSGEYTTVKVPLTGINGERYSTVGFEADRKSVV